MIAMCFFLWMVLYSCHCEPILKILVVYYVYEIEGNL